MEKFLMVAVFATLAIFLASDVLGQQQSMCQQQYDACKKLPMMTEEYCKGGQKTCEDGQKNFNNGTNGQQPNLPIQMPGQGQGSGSGSGSGGQSGGGASGSGNAGS